MKKIYTSSIAKFLALLLYLASALSFLTTIAVMIGGGPEYLFQSPAQIDQTLRTRYYDQAGSNYAAEILSQLRYTDMEQKNLSEKTYQERIDQILRQRADSNMEYAVLTSSAQHEDLSIADDETVLFRTEGFSEADGTRTGKPGDTYRYQTAWLDGQYGEVYPAEDNFTGAAPGMTLAGAVPEDQAEEIAVNTAFPDIDPTAEIVLTRVEDRMYIDILYPDGVKESMPLADWMKLYWDTGAGAVFTQFLVRCASEGSIAGEPYIYLDGDPGQAASTVWVSEYVRGTRSETPIAEYCVLRWDALSPDGGTRITIRHPLDYNGETAYVPAEGLEDGNLQDDRFADAGSENGNMNNSGASTAAGTAKTETGAAAEGENSTAFQTETESAANENNADSSVPVKYYRVLYAPKKTMMPNYADLYYQAARLVDAALFFRNHGLALALTSGILLLLSWLFLIRAAGWKMEPVPLMTGSSAALPPDKDATSSSPVETAEKDAAINTALQTIAATGDDAAPRTSTFQPIQRPAFIDRVPLELYTLGYIFITAILITIISEVHFLHVFFTGIAGFALALFTLAVCFLPYSMSIARRIKNRLLYRNTLLRFVIDLFAHILRGAVTHTHLLLRAGIVMAILWIAQFFVLALTNFDWGLQIFLFTVYKIAESIFVFWVLLQFSGLREQTLRVEAGDYGTKADTRLMLPSFAAASRSISNISSGLHRAVEEQMKSERMRSELITNVSHDIKTPLTSIINYVDLLEKAIRGEDIQRQTDADTESGSTEPTSDSTDETGSPALSSGGAPKNADASPVPDAANAYSADVLAYLDILKRQSARLKKLLTDLIDASRASTGNVELTMEPCDLRVLLDQVIGEYEERMAQQELTLELNAPESCTVYADGRQLFRVFDNLFGNVCKYALPGTRVYVDVHAEPDGVFTEIKNISRDKLNITGDELTERFVRGDASRGTEGSGLGLSIARSLAGLMHGALHINIDGDLFKATLQFSAQVAVH